VARVEVSKNIYERKYAFIEIKLDFRIRIDTNGTLNIDFN
jgi:hypothetical protein